MESLLGVVAKLNIIVGFAGSTFAILVFSFSDAWTALSSILSNVDNIKDYPGGTLFLSFLAFHSLLIAIPSLIAGVGMLKRQEWSRDLAVVCAVVQLAGIPVGTLIGGFSLWALFLDASDSFFHGGGEPRL
jgi:hypothetical protein